MLEHLVPISFGVVANIRNIYLHLFIYNPQGLGRSFLYKRLNRITQVKHNDYICEKQIVDVKLAAQNLN